MFLFCNIFATNLGIFDKPEITRVYLAINHSQHTHRTDLFEDLKNCHFEKNKGTILTFLDYQPIENDINQKSFPKALLAIDTLLEKNTQSLPLLIKKLYCLQCINVHDHKDIIQLLAISVIALGSQKKSTQAIGFGYYFLSVVENCHYCKFQLLGEAYKINDLLLNLYVSGYCLALDHFRYMPMAMKSLMATWSREEPRNAVLPSPYFLLFMGTSH